MKIYQISKYLPDTALNSEHPRAIKMRELLEKVVKGQGGELLEFAVEDGVATIQVNGEKALQYLIEEFKRLENVEVTELSIFEYQHRSNKVLQAKVDAKRANKKAKENQ